jgi:hypothetical protein
MRIQVNRRRKNQLAFHDWAIGFSGARINPENRWVKLANIVPWDLVDQLYAENFIDSLTGHPAIESRIAFGALIIKQEFRLSDEDTVQMICENPHVQYFLGLSEFTWLPLFDSSKMVFFRKRFPPEAMAKINEAIIAAEKGNPPSAPMTGSGNDSAPDDNENTGTLILDATCAPANVHFPTDTGLLNDAREASEQLVDALFEPVSGQVKPRTYRQKARQSYLRLVRNKRPGYRLIRKTIRQQLQYLRRNLYHIGQLSKHHPLNDRQTEKLEVIDQIYKQQRQMYDGKLHKIEHRIVSVHQPWVRPIVRGKLTAKVEFGAKLALSMEDGYSRIEMISWDAFNESKTLIDSCERYFERNGCYPERILADKIYRNRTNLHYCDLKGIKMNGPKLGRPPRDKAIFNEQKRLEKMEAGERNAIEGKFGEAKQRYGLDRVMTRLSETSESVIHLIVVVMNLKKRLRDFIVKLLEALHSGQFRFQLELLAVTQ